MGDPLLFLVGPTASGKSALAVAAAEEIGAEIACMDSMQVYRGMDIGTAKPGPAERARVPHHLLDLADPRETFSTGAWARRAREAIEGIRSRGRVPLFVGGTMLYLRALAEGIFEGPPAVPEVRERLRAEAEREGTGALHRRLLCLDPAAAGRIRPGDQKRIVRALEVIEVTGRRLSEQQREWGRGIAPGVRAVALVRGRPELDRRIGDRVRGMLASGWTQEVRNLRSDGALGPTAGEALGYREIGECLAGTAPWDGLEERIARRTRRFARKQEMWIRGLTWLSRLPVEGEAAPHLPGLLRALEAPAG